MHYTKRESSASPLPLAYRQSELWTRPKTVEPDVEPGTLSWRNEERRRFFRQPLGGWEVWVMTPARRAYRAGLCDFTLGGRGLLVHCPPLGTPLEGDPAAPDDHVVIGVSIPLGKTNRTFREYGKVVRRYPEGIAVALIRPDVRLLKGLQAMAVKLGRCAPGGSVHGTTAYLFNRAS